ncbi:MAG: ATP synthase F1 subunit epsilon [Candidatus Krumholzibacteriia bacterium]
MKSLKVNIVTPEKVAWEAEAVSVTLPGSEGYLGVWAHHAPLVTGLQPGVITIKLNDAGDTKIMACSGGFVEISHNTVNIMTDTCEEAGQIDANRAKAALERAKKRLAAPTEDVDIDRAILARQRAEARIAAVEKALK